MGLQKKNARREEDTDSAYRSRQLSSYKKLVMKFPFSVVLEEVKGDVFASLVLTCILETGTC